MRYLCCNRAAALIIALLLGINLLTGCAFDSSVHPPKENAAVIHEANEKEAPFVYYAVEPAVRDVSDAEKAVSFYRDGMELKGELILPEGEGTHPAVILSGGMNSIFYEYEDIAKEFAKNGYAAVLFNFRGIEIDESEQDDMNKAYGKMMVSQLLDLFTVMDSLEYLPGVDTDNVYLWGHSFGGLVTAYAGCVRQDGIKGMMLAEPSLDSAEDLCISNEPKTVVNIYKHLAECEVDTVIFVGTHDGYGDDPHAYDKAIGALPSGELITIDGADHYFDGEYGRQIVDKACEHFAAR